MNTLPKDMVGKLIDELSAQDFISFCSSNVDPNVIRVCNMDEIWIRRLKKDFSEVVLKFPKILKDPKKVYLKLFTSISKLAETYTESVLVAYGSVRKFLSPEFSKLLYNEFYKIILYALVDTFQELYYKEIDVADFSDWVTNSVDDVLIQDYFIDFADEYFPGYAVNDERELNRYWKDTFEDSLERFIRSTILFLRKY